MSTNKLRSAAHHALVDNAKKKMFMLGSATGASLTLFLVSVGAMNAAYDPRSGAINELSRWSYPLFRGSFLISFSGMLYGVVLFAWRRSKIDYAGAFGIDGSVTYQMVLSCAYGSFCLNFGCFCLYATQLIVPGNLPSLMLTVWPLLAFVAPLVVLLWPSDRAPLTFAMHAGSRAARLSLLTNLVGPCLVSPLSEPTFARTFTADVMCSMPKILLDVQFALCALFGVLTTRGSLLRDDSNAVCEKGGIGYRAVAVVLSLAPFVIRLGQASRAARYARTRDARRMNALNALKYFLAVSLVACAVAKQHASPERAGALTRLWLFLSLTCTAFNFCWDVFVDWGLPRRERHFAKWHYAVAVATNFFARLGWAIYVSPEQQIAAEHVVLLLGCVEIMRRFQWALFRVEHEHIKRKAHAEVAHAEVAVAQRPASTLSSRPARPTANDPLLL